MHITAAEAHVMEALWRREPMSADDLVAEVGASQQWGEATVKTLINRLLKKKAIKSERAEGRHGYRPLVDRSAYVQAESQGLLDRLFDLSDAARPVFSGVPAAERERLMRSKTEYLELYGALKEFPLAVSRETGALLYMLARSIGAKTIVEFGTSFGVSTLHLAAAAAAPALEAEPAGQQARLLGHVVDAVAALDAAAQFLPDGAY